VISVAAILLRTAALSSQGMKALNRIIVLPGAPWEFPTVVRQIVFGTQLQTGLNVQNPTALRSWRHAARARCAAALPAPSVTAPYGDSALAKRRDNQ
jgi:hypothetical protein